MTDKIGRLRRPSLFSIPIKKYQKFGLFGFTKLKFLEKLIFLVNFDYFPET